MARRRNPGSRGIRFGNVAQPVRSKCRAARVLVQFDCEVKRMTDEYAEPTSSEYPPSRSYPPQSESTAARSTPGRSAVDEALAKARRDRTIWFLGVLLLVLLGPSLLQRFQYAYTLGKERARVDVALEGLEELDKLSLQGLAEASRLVAQKVGVSVVHIRTLRQDGRLPGDEAAYLFGGVPQAVGQGSGVIIDEDGYIVTNHHVIAGARQVSVHLKDGRAVPAQVVGADVLTDIALLKVEADGLVAVPWGDSSELEPGDLVWAVGSPFGLQHSVTFGIVSAKGRRGVTASPHQSFLQSDVALNPGNSGGPLVDARGEVVGINTAIVGQSYRGISFAIPSVLARDVVDRLRAQGKVARGWLGVSLDDVSAEAARKLGLPVAGGALIRGVVRESPAERAGLQPGDIILKWNGETFEDRAELSRMVAATEIGSKATITVFRQGQQIELEVRIDERPQAWG